MPRTRCGRPGLRARYIAGCATRHFLGPLAAASPLAGLFEPLYVENGFFGGNVDVTGLLCGCDIAAGRARGRAAGRRNAIAHLVPPSTRHIQRRFGDAR
ncbi:MAG TPA: DUF512 domain-containing protein [Eggerthellaceae bacterium]|nr:DUF512 domain-containing protein [Eggerthellaceae bacterium]